MSPRARFLQSGSIIDGAILPFRHSLRADLSSGCNENRTADVKAELSFSDWLIDVLIRDDESIRFHQVLNFWLAQTNAMFNFLDISMITFL